MKIPHSGLKNAGCKERRAELRRSARRQQFIIKVSSWRFYNRQKEVLNQKSSKVIDSFVFNYLAVDNAGQTADNKHTGGMIFTFFLLASKTDKPLGDDTFSEPVSETHLLTGLFLHKVLKLFFFSVLL